MLKLNESSSPPIDGLLFFDLFAIRYSEPFLVMYGFSAAYGYKPTELQMREIQRNMTSRAIFEKWRSIGDECKAGRRPLPEWVRDTKEVSR